MERLRIIHTESHMGLGGQEIGTVTLDMAHFPVRSFSQIAVAAEELADEYRLLRMEYDNRASSSGGPGSWLALLRQGCWEWHNLTWIR